MSGIGVRQMADVGRERQELGLRGKLTASPGHGKDSPLKRAVVHAILIFASIVVVFPVVRVFSTALRPGQNVLNPSLDIVPEGASLDAFYRVLFETNLLNWLFNSLMVTLGTATIGVTIAAVSAYGFSRYKFRARGTGLTFLFATQLIPGVMLLVPVFVIFVSIGLVNTYQGLVFAYAVTAVPFSIWILKGYYDTIPIDLEEAARIDGCNQFQAFYRVLLPLSLPALAIVFLFNFLAAWGEYFFARVLIGGNEDLLTWTLGLQRFQAQFQTQWADLSAASIIVSIPIVILFVYISKYLVSGLTLGGVKG
jgi:arabinogalactan oligomer / maltooligosaccharide transport system permease protein